MEEPVKTEGKVPTPVVFVFICPRNDTLLVPALQLVERVPETKSTFPAGLLTCCVTLETSLNLSEP